MDVFKLCYVDGNFAYFTKEDPHEVKIIGKDEAPYELYSFPPEDADLKVAFDGDFIYAYEKGIYSITEIMQKSIPWLQVPHNSNKILTGSSLTEFMQFISSCNGSIYFAPDAEWKSNE